MKGLIIIMIIKGFTLQISTVSYGIIDQYYLYKFLYFDLKLRGYCLNLKRWYYHASSLMICT